MNRLQMTQGFRPGRDLQAVAWRGSHRTFGPQLGQAAGPVCPALVRGRVMGLVRCDERPALAPFVDEHRAGAGLGEAGTQAGDVTVDGAFADLLVAPDAARELVLAEDAERFAGEFDEQLVLQAAEMHDAAGDGDALGCQVDVDLAGVQMPGDHVLEDTPDDGREYGAQDDVAGAVGEVVVAAALIRAQCGQLVVVTERDDGQAGMHARVLSGAYRAQQCRCVEGSLKLANDQDVDRVARQLGDDRRGVVGLVDGVPIGVQLSGQKGALLCVDGRDEDGVLRRWLGVLQGMDRHVVSRPFG